MDADTFFADWVVANLAMQPTGIYGYPQTLSNLSIRAQAAEAAAAYPHLTQTTTAQYAAHYITLVALDDVDAVDALTITLNAPGTVALVDPTERAPFWYSNRADQSATTLTRAFDLTDVTSAALSFRAWYEIERDWDWAYVMVSDDGGATWTTLPGAHTTTDDPHAVGYGPGYTGASGGWVDETMSLDAYVGREILLRFAMITDDGITGTGFAVDDVRIDAIGYASTFDTPDDWDAEGFVWTDNRLPQQFWVQAIQQRGDEVIVTRWRKPPTDASASWVLPLEPGIDGVTLAVSPFAPVTLRSASYTLSIAAGG